jgi:hypothetical protein
MAMPSALRTTKANIRLMFPRLRIVGADYIIEPASGFGKSYGPLRIVSVAFAPRFGSL